MRIGEVAAACDVPVATVRYYERRGLVPDPPRRASGYRRYPPDTVERIRFIQRAKELGFTLEEIGELLRLRVDPGSTCEQVRRRAEAKIADVEDRIRSLETIRRALGQLADACAAEGPVSECPILDVLEGGRLLDA